VPFDSFHVILLSLPLIIFQVGVLLACSHTCLTERAIEYFYSLSKDYGITRNSKHYNCMIDLLGGADLLEEAHNLMRNMTFEPNDATWGTG